MSESDGRDHAALLAEINLLWGGADDHQRAAEPPRAAVAVGAEHAAVDDPPDLLLLIKDVLDRARPTVITSCLSYLIPPGTERAAPPSITLATSAGSSPAALTDARPDPQWEPEEWQDLLAGRLGPWVIALHEDRVAALCHTPRDSGRAAEAGVWTHPDHRGRGYAEVVVAAWATVAGASRNRLFYSHFDDNPASRSVARKLRARPIGRIWQLRDASRTPAD